MAKLTTNTFEENISQLSHVKSATTIVSSTKKKTTGVRYEFSQRQKDDFKKAFDVFDVYGTGRIEVKELKVAFRALGFEPTKRELKELIREVDKDNTGKLSFSDFLFLLHKKFFEKDNKVNLMKSFRLMDQEKKGKINIDSLRQVATELGVVITKEELREMISEADTDGDGEIGPSDFIAIMTKYYD